MPCVAWRCTAPTWNQRNHDNSCAFPDGKTDPEDQFLSICWFSIMLKLHVRFRAPHSGWKHLWLFWGWQWDEPTADFAWHQLKKIVSTMVHYVFFIFVTSYCWSIFWATFCTENHQGEEQTARVCTLRMPLLQGRRRRRTTGLFVWLSWWKVGELGTEQTNHREKTGILNGIIGI